ncbi:sortilin-related receptor-like isoform X2 [Penaeus japonicus]|uniref:sortilin-related receptor-like isoform X2 n=1 Tax=Penaeus japonicus TaxID=27405 RepID=UPI001C716D80|nr:sortilin-related receptor-like isoform X2 [Penaeus japonicus]
MAATRSGGRTPFLCFVCCLLISLLCLEACDASRTTSASSSSRLIRVRRAEEQKNPLEVIAGAVHGRSAGDTSASDRHRRVSRAADTADDTHGTAQPSVSVYKLANDSHHHLIINWAGEGSKVVVCMTRDSVQDKSSKSNVYVSYDYGSTFQEKTSKFQTAAGKPAIINKMYKNEKFTSMFVFTDVINKRVYVTRDYCQNVISHKVIFTPSEISHHPVNAEVLLAYDIEDEERKLWISEDFGVAWRVVERYVKTYYWSEMTSPPTLYVVRKEPSGGATVLSSQMLFREGYTPNTVISRVEDFEVKDEFLFAIKKVHLLGAQTRNATLQMWISYRGGPFLAAEFPNSLTHQHYYVADISEGQIMVCVAHDEILSNLYVSSVPRSANHVVSFSLSLERILYFNPTTNWVDTWLSEVASKTFADLHPVEGIRGVFIASQLMSNFSKSPTNLHPEHLSSFITFNQGAQWKPLQPPQKDAYRNPITCERKNNCSLHVSQELSHLYPSTHDLPILSKKSAPGLILATGTIGTSLKGYPGLYLSTDAGVNWYEALKGNYLYTFGDHGGVIVAVQMYKVGGETNELNYSTDDGETWQTIQFFQEKLRIFALLTEPGENTTIFTLFGSRVEHEHQWIIIKVDMASVFRYPCKPDDYKRWSPSDGRSGRLCLLGRKEVYERRIGHSNCYNGQNYDRPISVENCPCNREDFECDYGYKDNMGTQECAVDSSFNFDPHEVPPSCKPGEFYNRTKGYRKIPGDTCEGGRDYMYLPTITACPVSKEQEFLLVSARQEILRYNLVDPGAGLRPLPIPNLRMVIALDFDMKNNCIYWSDINEDNLGIKRLCFDGHSDVEVLVDTDLQSVEGLAFDWISNNLYFVDGELKSVEVIRTDIHNYGRMRRSLLTDNDLDNPRGIAVHPLRGYLYITDWSETNPKVARTYLDGTNWKVLFDHTVVGWPNGITIDFQTERIFFADAKLDYIASADLDGQSMRKIISDSDKVIQPFAVGVYKSLLFWDDWQVHQVLQADKNFGWGISTVGNMSRSGLVDLKVFGHWSQQGTNACTNNTQCTHLCMGLPNNQFACLCPQGMKINRTGLIETCSCPDGSPISSNGTCKVKENNTCPHNFFTCNSGRCIPKQWVCDSDNDCGDNSDEDGKKCGHQSCEPPSWQCKNGQCIAQSWRCDFDDDCGDHSDEDGCQYVECPENTFKCKNGRCIEPHWRCDMENDCRDGSDEENCTSSAKPGCRDFTCASDGKCLPNSWRCDGDKDCSDGSDESNCKDYTCEKWQFQCKNQQCIFKTWECDGEPDCGDKSDEINCENVTTTTPEPFVPTDPVFPTSNHSCSVLLFRCGNQHCVPFWWKCDGLDDCGDGSDEEGCDMPHVNVTIVKPATPVARPSTCPLDQFQCSNGDCIWETWVCDKDNDCPDGEDEKNCHQFNTCSLESEFKCRYSGGCISSGLRCDSKEDCADGSDEDGCESVTQDVTTCPDGFFMCDGGSCLELFKRCNNKQDCVDLSDEQNCTTDEKAYQVTDLTETEVKNVSVSLKWSVNAAGNIEYQPSIIVKAALGNHNAWQNKSWTENTTYTFSGLEPYTQYIVKVYVREKNTSKVFPPSKTKIIHTEQGFPSPPFNVEVEQVGYDVVVTWMPPIHPNGPINAYHVYMFPPNPAREVLLSGNGTTFTVPSSSVENGTLVWVTVMNQEYMSDASERKKIYLQSTETEVDIVVNDVNTTSVSISWDAVPGVDGYMISHNQPENKLLTGNVIENTTTNEAIVRGLAPGQKYIFKVTPFKDKILWPASSREISTSGDTLKEVTSLQAQVMKDVGTTVKLTWSEPPYKTRKIAWNYRIVWGKSPSELKNGKNVLLTNTTSLMIDKLDACETYHVAVMLGGPMGIGPATVKQVQTLADPLSPPKNLKAQRTSHNNKTMVISWEPACQQLLEQKLQYLLIVRDVVFNKTSYIELPSKKTMNQTHTIKSHWGGKYLITVQNSQADARPTPPVVINGPMIPPPYELTYNPGDNSFFWKRSRNFPTEMANQSSSYILYISKNMNMSDATAHPCSSPPVKVDSLSAGIIYYATVAFKDVDGYLSPQSHPIRLEKPIGDKIVLSQGSVVGVGISVFFVVVALIVVVGVLGVRHRRLARSFLTFANTHYDRSQGTTLITTDHNLDEDDDSPMIRGFSDDEPLVIA